LHEDANGGRREAVRQAVKAWVIINENITRKHRLKEVQETLVSAHVEIGSCYRHKWYRSSNKPPRAGTAIQATMAGVKRKGFGTVAADIRRLAERKKKKKTGKRHKIIKHALLRPLKKRLDYSGNLDAGYRARNFVRDTLDTRGGHRAGINLYRS